MDQRIAGWLFVAAQAVLLITLVALPTGSAWPVPNWLDGTGSVFFFGGLLLIAAAALRLGTSLTPTPVPRRSGDLITSGLYRWMRHPIYTGVLAVVVGIGLRSANWLTAAVAVATIVFFHVKAAWEERRLADHYPGYRAYAERTPRFVPRPW